MSSEQPPGPPIDPSLGPRQRAAAEAQAAAPASGIPLYRRPVVIVIAAVVALVVVIGLVLALFGGSSSDGSTAADQPASTGTTEFYVVLAPATQTSVDGVATAIGCKKSGSALRLPDGGAGGVQCLLGGKDVLVYNFKDTAGLQSWANGFAKDKVTGMAQGATVAVVLDNEKTAAAVRQSLGL